MPPLFVLSKRDTTFTIDATVTIFFTSMLHGWLFDRE